MTSLMRAVLVASVVLGGVGCWSGDGTTFREEESSAKPDDAIRVDGEWEATKGDTPATLTIHQSGAHVTGTTALGRFEGTLDRGVMTGTYNDGIGQGPVTAVFSQDGRSFGGTWGDQQASFRGTKKN